MSDFAGERLRDGSQTDEHWRHVLREQTALMANFGAMPLTNDGLRIYEAALLERNLPILIEHKVGGLF
jgi:hypothetical protein